MAQTDDKPAEESTDQPTEESTNSDQPDTGELSEESKELLEDESQDSESEDQPTEESEESEEEEDQKFQVGDKEITLDEMKLGYMRNSDYTQKTQELAAIKKDLDKKPAVDLSPEEKQVQEFLNKYGVVTKAELQQQLKLEQARVSDQQNFGNWKSGAKPSGERAEAVFNLGKAFPKMSYSDIDKKYFGTATTQKKVVKRKVVGMKGKGSGNKVAGDGFTREQIARMSIDDYKKNEVAIKDALAKGEIK